MILLFRKHGFPSRMPSKQGNLLNLSLCMCACVYVVGGGGGWKERKGRAIGVNIYGNP